MKNEKKLDLVIIGAGAAGLTASIYAARSKLNTVVLEDELVGGQIRNSSSIENFPGFDNISGEDLSNKFQEQALKLGANINEFGNIKSLKLKDDEKIIETEDTIYKPKAVIIATGAKPRELPVPEEKNLHGKAIHYCELCDGAIYTGKDLVVVGGGSSAIEAANYLTKFAKNITIVHRRSKFSAEKAEIDNLFKHDNVSVIWNAEVVHVLGDNKIEKIIIRDRNTDEESEIHADGIFAYVGYAPKTNIFSEYIKLTENGYIETDDNMMTNVSGVFAAGDVRQKEIRQLTTAVSDGTIAAIMSEKYILGGK